MQEDPPAIPTGWDAPAEEDAGSGWRDPDEQSIPNGIVTRSERVVRDVAEIIFLGTGTSGNVPNIHCLTKDEPDCKTCLAALEVSMPPAGTVPRRAGVVPNTPVFDKNRRRNTAAVVRYMHSDGRMRTLLIDCGKTFYESALTWFIHHNLRQIDGVLLTHGHADAMLGLDDLRQWTIGGKHASVQDHIDVYLSSQTMGVVESAFPYLVDRNKATGGGDVPSLNFHVLEGTQTFVVGELEVTPLPVEHGVVGTQPFMSLGFRFGDLAYVSDVSRVPDETRRLMEGVTTLVLDALHYTPHASHLSIPESITTCLSILPHNASPPARAFLTGFSHRVHHDTLAKELENDERVCAAGVVVEPAWDGLRVVMR